MGHLRLAIRHHEDMHVEAQITLWPSDREFRLPAATRSMLFRFGEEGTLLGAQVTSVEGTSFAPGTHHSATVEFWADEAADEIVATGSRFVVWYGGVIGEGSVTAIR